jgi:hypothetical protein
MSPKAVLNPRIKISKTGRAYVDVADLVNARRARIAKARQAQQDLQNGSRNGNQADAQKNNDPNTHER